MIGLEGAGGLPEKAGSAERCNAAPGRPSYVCLPHKAMQGAANKKTPIVGVFLLAAELGFEPRQYESES